MGVSVQHWVGADRQVRPASWGDLAEFRREFYACLTLRADALFELTDAVLCAEAPVATLVGLSMTAEHRRGHGALYDGLAGGWIDYARLRRSLATVAIPRDDQGRIVLAVDVSPWLRPDAPTCADRCFCHVYGRGKNHAQMIPGWPYSFVAALETGATSWTTLLDAVRLSPAEDGTEVTAAQLREVIARLRQAGHWREGDPPILVVFDAGYDTARLSYLLTDLPVELLGRVRSDRVFCPPPASRAATGRPPRHGSPVKLADDTTWPEPDTISVTDTRRYGRAEARSWHRLHPRLKHQGAWADHPGPVPTITGALIRLHVDHLPGDHAPTPVWLWSSRATLTAPETDRLGRAYLRRFDLEHTFRFLKQTLGWTRPRVRTPAQADRWTWLIITAHTQLRLARHLTEDLRRPWEKPATEPHRLTPARVRRGFRYLRAKTTLPASAPKPSRPGPGRPPGSKNKQRAHRHDVGKHATNDSNKVKTP